MKERLSNVFILTALIFISSRFASLGQTPLPDNIAIIPPTSAIASNAVVFSGAWIGFWDDSLPSALVVERIDPGGKVHVIYSWGDQFNIHHGWVRQSGQIINGKLHLPSTNGVSQDFSFAKNGNLLGRFEMADNPPSFIEMVRIPSTNAQAIKEAARKVPPAWEEKMIPVHSQAEPVAGKTFQLQTTIYRQSSPGRHPVVIFNHGSTGPGIIPATMVFRAGKEKALFHSLGYIEVVPMRKGRGTSEGPNLEEDKNVSPAIQLDSAVEDLHAVIEYLSQQPDVDASRIILAGVSRGGMLSVAYAGRYPANVSGVINFSGGWFSEGILESFTKSGFNFQSFRAAGHNAKVPMLWLYADHDSFYSLKFVEGEFADFRSAGGRGELAEVRDLPGDGHMLCLWPEKWQGKVTDYLHTIGKKDN